MKLRRLGQRVIAELKPRSTPNTAIAPSSVAETSWWAAAPADGFTRRAEAERERMRLGRHGQIRRGR